MFYYQCSSIKKENKKVLDSLSLSVYYMTTIQLESHIDIFNLCFYN